VGLLLKEVNVNLLELKSLIDTSITNAKEFGEDPKDITVSIQIDRKRSSLYSDDVELIYDGNGQASGCVLHGWEK